MIERPEIYVSTTLNTEVEELGAGIRHLTLVMYDAACNVGADTIPVTVHVSNDPEIMLTRSVAVPAPDDNILVNATITDISEVASVLLSHTVGVGEDRTNATMSIAGSHWTTTIPQQLLGFSA